MPAKSKLPEVGTKFGMWEFLEEVATGRWLCQCACGVTKPTSRSHVVSGRSTGCGHDRREKASAVMFKHGSSLFRDRVYSAWKNAKSRCFNPANEKYPTYGGRGISMHLPWVEDFVAFRDYIGPPPSATHSLGRINNDKGYEPGNLEWQTPKVQALNRSNNRVIEYNGTSKTLAEWAESSGIPRDTIHARLTKLGWSIEKALTTKVSGRVSMYGIAVIDNIRP